MRNFFSRLMYGRYGSDVLGMFLFVVGVVFYLLGIIIPGKLLSSLFSLIGFVAMLITVLRMWSRDYGKRRAENDWFVERSTPIMQGFMRKRAQMRDKDHAYFRCPSCGQVLRVPKGKNKISITCRNCGTVFQKKT